jgi:hypothetical protein
MDEKWPESSGIGLIEAFFRGQVRYGGGKKGLGKGQDLWYYFVAFDALVSPLER